MAALFHWCAVGDSADYNSGMSGDRPRIQSSSEIVAGLTTFLAMAYILVVQPAVLTGESVGLPTGLIPAAVFTVTGLAAILGCLCMGFIARLPIAAAPGMGLSAFFIGLVALAAQNSAMGDGNPEPWREALGCVFAAAVLLVAVSLTGLRRVLADAVDGGVQRATCAGIGLFIAVIGLKNSGIVAITPGTGLGLTHRIASPDSIVLLVGLAVGAGLVARGKMTGIAVSMVAALALAWALHLAAPLLPHAWTHSPGWTQSALVNDLAFPSALFALPPSPAPLLLGLDPWAALRADLVVPTIALFLALMFDATGTILAVTGESRLVEGTAAPAFRRALLADSLASVGGALLGASSVTAYVESATGITAGGRTGRTALVVAACFAVALFAWPLLSAVAAYPPATAAALVIVGALMVRSVADINWRDAAQALPALLVLIGIPSTSSIAVGLGMGLVASPVVLLLAGRKQEVRPLAWVLAVMMAAFLVWDGTH